MEAAGISAVFVEPVRTGVWTTGVASLPSSERFRWLRTSKKPEANWWPELLDPRAWRRTLSEFRELGLISSAEMDEALSLLRDPSLVDRIIGDFARIGIVGEQTNLLIGYLAATSRKLARPLGVLIQSSSAAGKSSVMEAVLDFVPEEEAGTEPVAG